MPESDRRSIRVRIGLERGVYNRFARLAEAQDVTVAYLIELAAWHGLVEVESRMELGVPPERRALRQLDEITAGAGGGSGTAPAVEPAAGAGEEPSPSTRHAAEQRAQYHVGSNLPRKPASGKGKKHR